MLRELYTAAMGMLPQQTRLEVAANNMANAGTTGFKKESVFETTLIDASAHLNNVSNEAEQNDPPVSSYVDFSKGAFQQTFNPFDLAIDNNNGFFVVQDENGKQLLTRAGHFKVATDGTISTMDGKLLVGADGPVSISKQFTVAPSDLKESTGMNIRIADNGEVYANQELVGTITLENVSNPETLKKTSNQCFEKSDSTVSTLMPKEETSIKQGWLENSNVDIVSEMVRMIELQRMFEAGSKVIHANNETLDQSMRIGRIT